MSISAWYEPAPGYWPLTDHVRADVCVVGLGGSGLAAIETLVGAGRRVVGIDAGEIAGGAAGRNGGLLLAGLADFHHDATARHGRERAVAMYRRTIAGIEEMARDHPDAVALPGSLRIAHDAAELSDCERQLAAMQPTVCRPRLTMDRKGRDCASPPTVCITRSGERGRWRKG